MAMFAILESITDAKPYKPHLISGNPQDPKSCMYVGYPKDEGKAWIDWWDAQSNGMAETT